ncbi:hypothetical protein [Bradyrhizobium sp. CCBAU 53340]|uniref:hypothetical protein n=1 Tax=Bradyrhizobium sp. CCBAU 53340 TaxID=1325112 RepID=UPI00188BF6DC|nr:hypothetical protein [Bradyrhizobium sp. CCBAU 53340]
MAKRRHRCLRGKISLKVIANMTRNAVVLLAAMIVSGAAGACGPSETNSTKALAASNKKPGIIVRRRPPFAPSSALRRTEPLPPARRSIVVESLKRHREFASQIEKSSARQPRARYDISPIDRRFARRRHAGSLR